MGSAFEDLSSRLWRSKGLSDGAPWVLDACLGLLGADAALMEIDDPDRGRWILLDQRGLTPEFAQHLNGGCREHPLLGPELHAGRRVLMPTLSGPLDEPALRAAGWKCCQASPLIGWQGELRGVLWTLSRHAGSPSEDALAALDGICRLTSDFIECCIEERMHAVERSLLQAALEDTSEAVIVHRRGGVDLFNDALVRMHGFPDRDSCARAIADPDFFEILQPKSGKPLPREEWPIFRAFAGETTRDMRLRIRRRDTGLARTVSAVITPIHDAEGTVVAGAVLLRDITELEREEAAQRARGDELERMVVERTQELELAREEAEHANAGKSRFLAAASHDLRQPLQAALAYLAMLRDELQRPDDLEACRRAESALGAMSATLDAILEYSRITRGALQPNFADFPAATVLTPLLDTYGAEAERKGLALGLAGDTMLRLHSDAVLLMRLVENLLVNALRYTEKGSITVHCGEPEAGFVRLEVRDTGIGIPAERLAEVFEAWVRLESPAKRHRQGLGLGLAIVRGIAELLGCRTGVRSEPGVGSCFWVDVPAADPAAVLRGLSPP